MDITDKIGRIFGLSGEEEERKIDKPDNDTPQDPGSEQKEPSAQNFSGQNILSFNSAASDKENTSARSDKLVQSKITTIKPKDFNDAQIVANCLRDNIPVILNFEETNTNDAKRIIDFISGTAYAIDAKIKQVSQRVFICAPKNVTVSSSEEDKKPGMTFID